ncbi:MAG TPA: hypothetical protein VFB38_19545 [Chthonomonadaceae bacterium]|nr:hypothetical protein [Chthonomonadaceae bacterium]
MPAIAQVHIDQALTNLSVMYRNGAYVADQVLPILPVSKRSDKYFVYRKEDFLSPSPTGTGGVPASLRRPGTEAAEIDYGLSTQNYFAEEYAYRGFVSDAEVAAADNPLQPDMDQTIQLTERLLLDNEGMVATLVGKRGNYPSSNKAALTTGGAGTSWASYSSTNSLPFNDIKNGKLAVIRGIAREPNAFLLSVDAARTLADHPNVKDLVKYTHQDALTVSGLPKVMRGLTVIEGTTQKNTAAEGLAYSGSNLWQADDGSAMALIFYRPTTPSLRAVSFGYTFEAPDDATGARGLAVRRWREEKRKGTMIEAAFLRDWRLIAVDGSGLALGGYLLTSVTA